MRVAYLGRYNKGSLLTGPEKVAKNLFEEMSKITECRFFTYYFDGREYGLSQKAFGREEIDGDKIFRLGAARMIAELISFKPDVIHIVNYERFAVIAKYVKLSLGCKVVYTVHGIAVHENEMFKDVADEYKSKDKSAERKIFDIADIKVFLSKQSIDIARKHYKINDEEISLIPNGIESEFRYRGNRNFSASELSIVFAGDPARIEKGYTVLQDAMTIADKSCKYYVYGNLQKTGNENLETFQQKDTKDFAEFLSDKHVLVLPSLYELFSLNAAEAMASGLAVIVSSQSGISHYIEHGVNGFIARNNSPEEYAEYINILNSDRKLLEMISGNAAKIADELDWKKIAAQYYELYK